MRTGPSEPTYLNIPKSFHPSYSRHDWFSVQRSSTNILAPQCTLLHLYHIRSFHDPTARARGLWREWERERDCRVAYVFATYDTIYSNVCRKASRILLLNRSVWDIMIEHKY